MVAYWASHQIPVGRTQLWRALILLALLVPPMRAQDRPANGVGGSHEASRAELEALVVAAEQLAASSQGNADFRKRKQAELEALRSRLRDGDLRSGDRIVLWVRGDSVLTDTFTVRPGPTLKLPNLPELELRGVLRAELQGHLTAHIGRFFREPVVEASALIRLGVLGEVDRPGYYFVATDGLLSDAIMAAGGPTRESDLAKATVRRGTVLLWERPEFREALMDGVTLDQLGLRSGDEIVIGQRRSRWESILRTAGYVSGIALSIYGAAQISR